MNFQPLKASKLFFSYCCVTFSYCRLLHLLATYNISVSMYDLKQGRRKRQGLRTFERSLKSHYRTSFVGGFSAGLAALSHSKFYARVHLIIGCISVANITCYISVTTLYKVMLRMHFLATKKLTRFQDISNECYQLEEKIDNFIHKQLKYAMNGVSLIFFTDFTVNFSPFECQGKPIGDFSLKD